MWAAALVEQEESSSILCIPRGTVANLNGSSYQCLLETNTATAETVKRQKPHMCTGVKVGFGRSLRGCSKKSL